MNKRVTNNKQAKIWIGSLLLLGLLIYVIWPFIVGGGQMSNFCKALGLGIGATQSDVQQLVNERGYKLYVNEQGAGIISDPRSMGRFICETQFSQGRLTSAHYRYND